MTKHEFITALKQKLSKLPSQEVSERINFYIEIIDDKIEDGKTECEAVAEIGSIDEISKQIIEESSLFRSSETVKPTAKLSAGMVILLALGFPVWFPLVISAFALVISLFVSVCSLVIALWATFGASVLSCPVGIIIGLFFNHTGNAFTSIAIIGASVIIGGLAILLFFASKKATDGIIALIKKITTLIKDLVSKWRAK